MVEWSEDHVAAIGSLNSKPLGVKWRSPIGKVRDWYVESRHLKGCSPRLCRLMTDGLTPTSKYWIYRSHTGVYGPSKPINLPSTEGDFTPTASMAGSREKLGTDPRIGQPSCCALCREPFFLGAVTLSIAVDDDAKGWYMWTTWDTYGLGPYADWAWNVCDVLVGVFLCRVYNDLNRRDSQIWVTACLWQSSRR
jgi:hypothetical protein